MSSGPLKRLADERLLNNQQSAAPHRSGRSGFVVSTVMGIWQMYCYSLFVLFSGGSVRSLTAPRANNRSKMRHGPLQELYLKLI